MTESTLSPRIYAGTKRLTEETSKQQGLTAERWFIAGVSAVYATVTELLSNDTPVVSAAILVRRALYIQQLSSREQPDNTQQQTTTVLVVCDRRDRPCTF